MIKLRDIADHPFYGGSGTQTIVYDTVRNHIVITNASNAPLMFSTGTKFNPDDFTMTLPPGHIFDDDVGRWDRVTITSTGEYYGYSRRNRDEWVWSAEFFYR